MVSIRKRRGGLFQLVTFFAVFTYAWIMLFPHAAFAETVQVPAGTRVMLQTTSTISPATANVGDTIELTVINDVIVGGKTVVKAGARATGEITNAKERGMIGIAAELGFVVRSCQAADGTTIMLTGNKFVKGKDKMVMSIGLALICCILFALMKGGDAMVPAGTQMDAMTAATTQVNI